MNLAKRIRLAAWKWLHRYPNAHLAASTAKLTNLPGRSTRAFIRPSYSDRARVLEYLDSIYFEEGYLHERLKSQSPKTILDIGANIGLSSLSLLREFPTVRNVIAVEAEPENFGVLEKNFTLWAEAHPYIRFEPIHAVASGDKDQAFSMSKLGTGNSRLSASGTFRFTPNEQGEGQSVSMAELVAKSEGPVICKMDIEGGEQFIFSNDTEWLQDIAFFTTEIHDRFAPDLINSSRDLIGALGNFAIVPDRDVLHCYRR